MSHVRLICGNCGKIEKFDSYDAAYALGWDTPDRFVYTACDQCLGVSVYIPMMHLQEARALEQAGRYDDAKAKRDEAAAETLKWEPRPVE
jgi:hypothetical protein